MSADLREFFADYCKAYDDYDAERIASFFHCPMLTVRQGKVILLETPEEILDFFSKLLDWYREIKYTKGVISAFEARPLGPNGAIVHILWSPTRADGTVISRFPQTYNLVSVDGQWKIFVSSRHE